MTSRSWKHPQPVGQMPWGRFVSTYSKNYNHVSERHLQESQQRPAAPAMPQTGREFWPSFYRTTNSTYGSYFQPPPEPPSPFGGPAPPVPEAPAAISSTPTESRTQDAGVVWKTWSGAGGPGGQLCHGLGSEGLEQLEVLYEDGEEVVLTLVCPACGEEQTRRVHTESSLKAQLCLPVSSGSTALTDVLQWAQRDGWTDWMSRGLTHRPALHPPPRRSSRPMNCVCTAERSCCCPPTLPLDHSVDFRESIRGPRTAGAGCSSQRAQLGPGRTTSIRYSAPSQYTDF